MLDYLLKQRENEGRRANKQTLFLFSSLTLSVCLNFDQQNKKITDILCKSNRKDFTSEITNRPRLKQGLLKQLTSRLICSIFAPGISSKLFLHSNVPSKQLIYANCCLIMYVRAQIYVNAHPTKCINKSIQVQERPTQR